MNSVLFASWRLVVSARCGGGFIEFFLNFVPRTLKTSSQIARVVNHETHERILNRKTKKEVHESPPFQGMTRNRHVQLATICPSLVSAACGAATRRNDRNKRGPSSTVQREDLLGSVNSVPCVSEPGNDVSVLIQLFVDSCRKHMHIRVLLIEYL